MKQIFRTLQTPGVSEFVNWEKFARSTQFAELAKSVVDHYRKHRDSTLVTEILQHFATENVHEALLLWFCDSCQMDSSFDGPTLRLTRSRSTRELRGSLGQYLRNYSGTAPRVRAIEHSLLVAPDERARRGGTPFLQGGAPGLGKRK